MKPWKIKYWRRESLKWFLIILSLTASYFFLSNIKNIVDKNGIICDGQEALIFVAANVFLSLLIISMAIVFVWLSSKLHVNVIVLLDRFELHRNAIRWAFKNRNKAVNKSETISREL